MRSRSGMPALGELELAVLEHLWEVGEADVTELHAAIGKRRRITPNTVGSAVERLHRKRLVAREKVSHAYRYRPVLSRDEVLARRLIEAAGGASDLARAGLLSAFVDLVAKVDQKALDELDALIAARRSRRSR